jgi:hypothetical protein
MNKVKFFEILFGIGLYGVMIFGLYALPIVAVGALGLHKYDKEDGNGKEENA